MSEDMQVLIQSGGAADEAIALFCESGGILNRPLGFQKTLRVSARSRVIVAGGVGFG